MGHTHYYSFYAPKKGTTEKVGKLYQKAVKDCQKIIKHYSQEFGGLSGYTAHTKIGQYGGVLVNGSENSGSCEDFVLREHYKQNESLQFCKTNMYPYDTVVTACLIVLKYHLKEQVGVSSDGSKGDWIPGFNLARSVLGLKSLKIPNSIGG